MGEKALSDHLSTIIEKIAGCKHTHADIAALRQLLRTSDRQIALQLGKDNVNIGQGQNIEIGDSEALLR
ncbi:MAG: hypothetical protein ICV63_15485 [Coleofasciculus sp. Co-bin14]|nr:hypothetical protein [Coleofasciculus sp. Co-bin14]